MKSGIIVFRFEYLSQKFKTFRECGWHILIYYFLFSFVLQAIESDNRLGAKDKGGYPSIRSHPLFVKMDFESLHLLTPPKILPFMPNVGNEVNKAF